MADCGLDAFLASAEAAALVDVAVDAREDVARRAYAALEEVGASLEALTADAAHGWLLHALPERFESRDPLARHVATVVRAMLAFAKVGAAVRRACDEMLDELDDALVHGRGHHHHHHGDGDRQAPYVRATPKVGRNDPCPCGSGKKFKKCHGA